MTNPAKKEYYLQQRWYNQSIARRPKQEVITPVSVLKQSLEVEKYVSTLDIFRMDKAGLEQYLLELLPNEKIELLKKFNEPETLLQIVHIILRTINSLPYNYSKSVIAQLNRLAEVSENAKRQIALYSREANKKYHREKHYTLLLFIISIILCLLFFLAGR